LILINRGHLEESCASHPANEGAYQPRPSRAPAHVNREYFILEKDGIPVVGIMHVDDLEHYLELRDPTLKEKIGKSNAEYHRGEAREANKFLAELRAPVAKTRK